MITDEQIRKVALVMAIVGVAGIVVISQYTGPEKLKANAVTEGKIGRLVEISGMIASYFSKDGHVFIDLQDETGLVQIVMFERTARGQKGVYELKKGDDVTVTGKVLLYKSEIEVQADKIEIVQPPE